MRKKSMAVAVAIALTAGKGRCIKPDGFPDGKEWKNSR